jgi:hypothetical protein
LLALLIGSTAMVFAVIRFRGANWNRPNFYLFLGVGAALTGLAVAPGIANILPELFNVGSFEFGRLLSLAVVTAALGFLLALYTKAKLDSLKVHVDRVFCAWAADDLLPLDADQRFKSVMIIMPAFNEARNLERLLPCIPRTMEGREIGVLVVDDGSEDDTTEVALRHGAIVARNRVNRGQGAASRVGYRALQRHRIEIGVTMDADGQHRPEDLNALLKPIMDCNYDLVIGSRVLGSQSGADTTRQLGVHLLSRFLSLVTGIRITDCSSGFKAFRIEKIRGILLREDQYQSSEVLIRAAKMKLRISEVPVHISDRRFGASHKGRNLTYGLFFFKAMVRAWLV